MLLDSKMAMEAEGYASKEHMFQEEAVKSMLGGKDIDLDALAEIIADKLKSG